MLAESKLVLAIAREVVYGKDDEVSSLIKKGNINWQSFKDSLNLHGLVPFAYISLKENLDLLPSDLVKALEATYNYYLFYANYLQQRFIGLFNVFQEKNVVLVPIKGMALLDDLYSSYPIRPSTDIDVLVSKDNFEQAVRILEDQGYKKKLEGLKESYWRAKQYHLIFTKEESQNFPLIVELHWDLDYPRKEQSLLPEMWKRLREVTSAGIKIKVLAPEDTLFVLALHLRHYGNILCLRDICDFARLLNKYSLSFDWKYVLEKSKKSKACATVFFALYEADLIFGVNIPEGTYRELNLPFCKNKLIPYFIKKNIFRVKQSSGAGNLYLKAHFLLYDNFWEPVSYILNIPLEQFAKYYGLETYAQRTSFLYKWRLIYMPLRFIRIKIKGSKWS